MLLQHALQSLCVKGTMLSRIERYPQKDRPASAAGKGRRGSYCIHCTASQQVLRNSGFKSLCMSCIADGCSNEGSMPWDAPGPDMGGMPVAAAFWWVRSRHYTAP